MHDITGEVFLGVLAVAATVTLADQHFGSPLGRRIDRAIERFALADPLSLEEAHELRIVPSELPPRPRRPRVWGVRS